MKVELLATERLTYRREATPLFMTFPVNPDGAPFLVSSPQGFVWVPEAMNGLVHTAVREIPTQEKLSELCAEIVDLIAEKGEASKWGNVHPLTKEGVEATISYVRYFGFADIDLLIPSQGDTRTLVQGLGEDFKVLEVDWLSDSVLAVPSDKSFFGTLGFLSRRKAIVLIHNPSRGIGIARP